MRDTRLRLVGLTALFTLVVLLYLLGIAATSFAQGGAGEDKTAPTITGWSPAGSIENTTLQTFFVHVSDEESGVDWGGITKASAQVAGGDLHSVNAISTMGGVQITIKAMYEPGPKSVTLWVKDNAGNIAESTHYFELIDSAPPVFGGWYVDGETAADDVWIVARSATFRVRISDEAPTLGMDSVTASFDHGLGVAISPGLNSYYEMSIEDLEDGPHSISLMAADKSGNASTSTLIFNVTLSGMKFLFPFPADGSEIRNRDIAPSIRIEEIPPNVLDEGSVGWTMTAPEGSCVTGEATWANSVSTYTPSPPLAGEGTYALSVAARNAEGLSARYPFANATWTFLLDATPPGRAECAVVADSDGMDPADVGGLQFTADPTPSINVTVWDNDGGSGFDNAASGSDITVVVYSDEDLTVSVPGTIVRGGRPGDNAGPWAATWTAEGPLGSGTYYYQAVAVDDAGNRGIIAEPAFTFVVDRTAPSVDVGAKVGSKNTGNLRRFTNDPEVTVTWVRSTDGGDPAVGLLGYELEIRSQAGGQTRDMGILIHTSGGLLSPSGDDTEQYISEALPLSSGTPYTAWIRAIDLLGNESDWFGAPFIFDPGRPGDPGKPAPEQWTNAGNTLSFGWTHATDARAGVAQSGVDLYEFQIKGIDNPLWDVLDAAITVDIVEDEDVDLVDPDAPLTGSCVFTLPTRLVDGNYVARVRAKDVAGNYSNWVESDPFSVTLDREGPTVVIMTPADTTTTNLSTFTWTWVVEDDEDSPGIRGYWAKLNDEAYSWTTEPVFTSSRLHRGANVLRVKGVDNLGNEGPEAEAPAVMLVDAVIFDVHPEPGAHRINEVSTIAFSVTGLHDGTVEVLLGNGPLEDEWRLVSVFRRPELSQFYILLDADVMQPGMLTVTIRIGDATRTCDYRVLSERIGFGFGRLRPGDWSAPMEKR